VKLFVKSETGPARYHNEDRCWISQDGSAFAVLDGCGQYGAVADAALHAIDSCLQRSDRDFVQDLKSFAQQVNDSVLAYVREHPDIRGSGTTLDFVIVRENQLQGVHVGDGRVYLIRDANVIQLSEDHTLVAQMVAEGQITPEQARTHPQRNVIMQAVGVSQGLDPQTYTVSLRSGDVVVACTDGIWSTVEPTLMMHLIASLGPEKAIEAIVTHAAPSNDNATLIIGILE
jgi:protein phosphatase